MRFFFSGPCFLCASRLGEILGLCALQSHSLLTTMYPNHVYGCKPYLQQSRGCLGCPKVPFMTNDKKPTGVLKKDSATNKASVVQDFWSSSTHEMDNSAGQSQISASSFSMSNPNIDAHSSSGSNPPEFVNRGMSFVANYTGGKQKHAYVYALNFFVIVYRSSSLESNKATVDWR